MDNNPNDNIGFAYKALPVVIILIFFILNKSLPPLRGIQEKQL